jgi:hypothetical protein
MDKISYLNLDCIRFRNEILELVVTQSVGIRVIYFGFPNGENIFAELSETKLDCPGVGKVNVYGGHRLWHAPQFPKRTHLPEDSPVDIKEVESGVEITCPTETKTGIQKSLRITLPNNNAEVIVDHTLKNEGVWPIETAPWAISALKPGGTSILPQMTEFTDTDGVWPNRCVALWPFTDINSKYIHLGNHFIFVEANMQKGKLKFGYPNYRGWMAYYINGMLFIKKSPFSTEESYFDMNSSSQVYCQPEFIEIETIGSRKVIAPGEAVTHSETWLLYSNIDFEMTEESVEDIINQLL